MRAFVFATLVALSTSVFACPDLSGKYPVCRSITGETSGSSDLMITQSVNNRITTYTVTSIDAGTNERVTETYRADGKTTTTTETDPDSGISIQLATNVSCNGTKVLNIKMSLQFGGEPAAQLHTTISKSGKTITMKTIGTNMGEEVNDTVICD